MLTPLKESGNYRMLPPRAVFCVKAAGMLNRTRVFLPSLSLAHIVGSKTERAYARSERRSSWRPSARGRRAARDWR